MAGEFCKERNARGRGCVLAEDHGGQCAFSSDEARALRVAHEAEMPRLQCSCRPGERHRRCPFHGDGVRAEFEPTSPTGGLSVALVRLSEGEAVLAGIYRGSSDVTVIRALTQLRSAIRALVSLGAPSGFVDGPCSCGASNLHPPSALCGPVEARE